MIHHIYPVGIGIIATGFASNGFVIAEESLQGISNSLSTCARLWAIVHLDRCATVLHQLGNSNGSFVRIAVIVNRRHLIPIDGGACGDALYCNAVSHTNVARDIGCCVGGSRTRTHLCVIHTLRHGRSDTARSTLLSWRIFRTEVVIRRTLIPKCLHQRSNGCLHITLRTMHRWSHL